MLILNDLLKKNKKQLTVGLNRIIKNTTAKSNPQHTLGLLEQYTFLLARRYYGIDLLNSLNQSHPNVYESEKYPKVNMIMDKNFAKNMLPSPILNHINQVLPAEDNYFVDTIDRNHGIPKQSFSCLSIKDVIHAEKRTKKAIKVIKQRNDYDKDDTLEIDRDISSNGELILTPKNYTIIIMATHFYIKNVGNQSKKKRLSEISSNSKQLNKPQFTMSDLRLILDALENRNVKHLMFSQFSDSDKHDWYRFENKLKYYLKNFGKKEKK